MAAALNLSSTPFLRQIASTRTPKASMSVRATSRPSESLSTSTSVGTKENEDRGLSSSSSSSFSPPPNFKPPEPKRFGVRPDKVLDVLGASLSLIFRLGTGIFVDGYSVSLVPKNDFPPDKYALEIAGFKVKETSKLGPRPEKPIEIYEFERYIACSVDPNTGVSMYESDDIIKYLVQNYGDGNVPLSLSLGLLTTLSEGFAMIGRPGRGSIYKPSKLPPAPLEIWAYEGSPFCKLVREVLVELELPHLVRCCARGSPKRQQLYEKEGHFQVPYLDDPNTGVRMFESAEIVEYLQATYAL
ncbi:uncharacterized protein E5676_scaffold352G003910 [Cucumis melo var. makuwa]|uniref:GST N-terminal domain-containing protein n=1 Tax=Cucumis melo var. makuwa TaxID=1194695 RepID=A0A5D3DNT9_CUCMM|nr:uncharacterized protein E5676_scaffold352G003910 [Cucumis melo var. makuwa]